MKAANSPVVMLVEDFEGTREMLRQMLELRGCRVLEAANGQEAIGLLRHSEFDLVLMDLNMPILDGFTTTLRIREYERTRDVPVVGKSTTGMSNTIFSCVLSASCYCQFALSANGWFRLRVGSDLTTTESQAFCRLGGKGMELPHF